MALFHVSKISGADAHNDHNHNRENLGEEHEHDAYCCCPVHWTEVSSLSANRDKAVNDPEPDGNKRSTGTLQKLNEEAISLWTAKLDFLEILTAVLP
jgi:hypothetical protein